MIFQGRAVLVYLEEDNIARAYFRIRPLMTQDGPVSPEMAAEFPDEGYLRIVPDKNEQHTFKERMRTLCGICLMDLRHQPAEANKIRTNKNYSPARGETNQYIIYSDAIRALPNDLCYQVIGKSDLKDAVTPCVYLRDGAIIKGPFQKDKEINADEGNQLPPDSSELHTLTLSDHQELLIYWPKQEEPVNPPAPEQKEKEKEKEKEIISQAAPAPAAPVKAEAAPAPEKPSSDNAYAQIQEMNTALSENANRLHPAASSAPAAFIPEQPQKPLTGTRLYQAPQRTSSPKRAHNPLMEAVDQQRYAAKYEAPGAVLPQNAELKDVSNPVDAFKRALQGLWLSTDAQQQAVDVLLSQPSMKALLSKAMAADGKDATLTAMKAQLQELEAERLMTLMQLDDAKKNLSAFQEEALNNIAKDQKKKIDDLKQAEQRAQDALAAAQKALEPLNEKCQEAAKKLADMQSLQDSHSILFLSPAAGKPASKAELIQRVEASLKAAGFTVEAGDALTMLTIYALSDQYLEMASENEADALAAYQAFANALGCSIDEAKWIWQVHVLETGDAPLFVRYCDADHALITGVLTASTFDDYAQIHAEDQDHPFARLIAEPSLSSIPQPLPAYAPVSKACIAKEMLKETALNQDTLSIIHVLRTALKAAGRPLPLCLVASLCRFIASTQNDLPGGVAEALDRGVCAYVVPHILLHKLPVDELKNLLAAMPRTLKALKIHE